MVSLCRISRQDSSRASHRPSRQPAAVQAVTRAAPRPRNDVLSDQRCLFVQTRRPPLRLGCLETTA
eukprot:6198301-Pleurochrysis_carterae.AAC.4